MLQDPVTKAPVTTRVIEADGWGRIGEYYDYSNESDANFRLMIAAPALAAALERCAEMLDSLTANVKIPPGFLELDFYDTRAQIRAALKLAGYSETGEVTL